MLACSVSTHRDDCKRRIGMRLSDQLLRPCYWHCCYYCYYCCHHGMHSFWYWYQFLWPWSLLRYFLHFRFHLLHVMRYQETERVQIQWRNWEKVMNRLHIERTGIKQDESGEGWQICSKWYRLHITSSSCMTYSLKTESQNHRWIDIKNKLRKKKQVTARLYIQTDELTV